MSLLAKQLESFRKEKGIPSGVRKSHPSILYSPQEAKQYEPDSFAALALRGLTELSRIDPDLAIYTKLFTGAPRERDLMTHAENDSLNADIKRLLLLLSPHLPMRAAQECLEGLLHNYEVYFHNLDDVIACALPYHDSPMFTKLVQGLDVEGSSRWSWMKKLKAEPATLVRSALAKVCSKDVSVIAFIGGVLQENLRLQKTHRALSSFFAVLWMDTIGQVRSLRPELVEAVLPTVQLALRKPRLRDSFHSGAIVAAAICLKADLSPAVQAQLVERMARHMASAGGSGGAGAASEQRSAAALLGLLSQVQRLDQVPEKALLHLASAGPEALVTALPPVMDCGNFLAIAIEACTSRLVAQGTTMDVGLGQLHALLAGLLEATAGVGAAAAAAGAQFGKTHVAAAAAAGALQGFRRAVAAGCAEEATAVLRGPLATLAAKQPAAASHAFMKAIDEAVAAGEDAHPLMQLMGPSCATLPGDAEGGMLPVLKAFSHDSTKVRVKAVRTAAKHLEAGDGADDAPRRRLLAGLILNCLQDEQKAVIKEALNLESFWTSSLGASAASSAAALLALLDRLDTKGQKFGGCLPQLFRCFSHVYQHDEADSEIGLRSRLDAALLPVVALSAAGLDDEANAPAEKPGKDAAKGSKELREAMLSFAAASEHPGLSGLSGSKKGSMVAALAQSATAAAVMDFCRVLEGKPWSEVSGEDGESAAEQIRVFGGIQAQCAAASILALALPRLLEPSEANKEDGAMVVRCAEACWQFAADIGKEPQEGQKKCTEALRALVGALFAAAAKLSASPASPASTKKRKGAAAASSAQSSMRSVAATLLCIILERPRALAQELRTAVSQHRDLLRWALLRVALGPSELGPRPGGHAAPGSVANALLLLRSLLSSGTACSWYWSSDQSLLMPTLCKVAGSPDSEVRSAALSLLETLRAAPAAGQSWASPSPMLQALQEAAVLRPLSEILPQKAWDAMGSSAPGLPQKHCSHLVDCFLAKQKEIELSRDAAGTVMTKFFGGTAAGKEFASNTAACSFLGLGFSMVSQTDPDASAALVVLLGALPKATILEALKEPLSIAASELSASLSAARTASEAPAVALLSLAAVLAAAVLQGSGKAKTASVEPFVLGSTVPVLEALAQRLEKGGDQGLSPQVVTLVPQLCSLASLFLQEAKVKAPKTSESTALALFRLSAVASPAAATDDADAGGTTEQATSSGAGTLVSSARTALVDAALDVALMRSLLSAKVLQGRHAAQAMEAFYPLVCAVGGDAPDLAGLLMALAKFTSKAAKGLGEAPVAESPVHFAMLGVAAICESLSKAGSTDVDVPDVCKSIKGVCAALGSRMEANVLGAMLRALAALAPLAPSSGEEPMSAPLAVCADALCSFPSALRADVLPLLRGGLRRLWQQPAVSDDAGPAEQDGLCQARLRCILHTCVLKNPKLMGDFGKEQCLGLANSAGLPAALDFLLLALVVRRASPLPTKSKAKRKPQHKDAGVDSAIQQVEEWMASRDDDIADEVLSVLASVPMDVRFHALASLSQTLVSLAIALAPKAAVGEEVSVWRGLLPPDFVNDIGEVPAARALGIGLLTLTRFVGEHGLPSDLDEGDFQLDGYPTSLEIQSESSTSTAALSLSYIAKSACMAEVLLKRSAGEPAQASNEALSGSCDRARQLRELVLRSLAVNHPLTLFRASSLSLRIPDQSPAALAGAAPGEIAHVLSVLGEALKERRELRTGYGADAEAIPDAEDAGEASCAELCAAVAQHVCGLLAPKKQAKQAHTKAAGFHDVAWSFLDELCRFGAKASPKPFLEVCIPAAAKCLQTFAVDFPGNAFSSQPGLGTRSSVATACVVFVHTVAKQLGRGIMDKLSSVATALLSLLSDTSEDADGAKDLHLAALQALKAVIHAVGHFLSPFLPRILAIATRPSPDWKTAALEEVARELVAGVRHRLLLPSVQAAVTSTLKRLEVDGDGSGAAPEEEEGEVVSAPTDIINAGLVEMQRFAVIHAWVFSSAQPDFVASGADAAGEALLRMLSAGTAAARRFLRAEGKAEDIPELLLKRQLATTDAPEAAKWQDSCAVASLAQLHELSAAAYTQFALRLSVEELRPRFTKILQWARGPAAGSLMSRQASRKASATATADPSADAEDACRALGVFAIMQGLTREAPQIAEEVFLPLALKDISTCLVSSRKFALQLVKQNPQGKKKRRTHTGDSVSVKPLANCTWWWLEVATAALNFTSNALQQAEADGMRVKAIQESVETLVDPSADLLLVCEFLPPLGESATTDAFVKGIQGALVALASAADSDHVKKLLTAVLERGRAEDADVRLSAVKTCHRIWADLGVQVVAGLSEVVMYAAELFEDSDERVEAAARAMVKTIEDCTGESLQEALKS